MIERYYNYYINMSRIYAIRHTKHEFINHVNNNTTVESSLVFIKKYHKYELFLDFLPLVLADIIMSYINDIINIPYILTFVDNTLCGKIHFSYISNQFAYNLIFELYKSDYYDKYILNYTEYDIADNIIFYSSSDYTNIILEYLNNFMFKYYNKIYYLPQYSSDTINKSRDIYGNNPKLLKQEIVIMSKVMSYLKKIEETKNNK